MQLEIYMELFLRRLVSSLNFRDIYRFGPVQSTVLVREPPFQVELFVMAPGYGAPDPHRHPNVDSWEVGLYGEMGFVVNGLTIPVVPGTRCHVGPGDWHSVANLPDGAAFYSIQRWDDGVTPTSVGLNWEGTIDSLAGVDHLKLLRSGGKWKHLKRGTIPMSALPSRTKDPTSSTSSANADSSLEELTGLTWDEIGSWWSSLGQSSVASKSSQGSHLAMLDSWPCYPDTSILGMDLASSLVSQRSKHS